MENYLTLYTNWSLTAPRYFYIRGAIWGLVGASLLWKVLPLSFRFLKDIYRL